MDERRQLVHDLAMVYVKEKFHSSSSQDDLQELIGIYYDAVTFLVNHLDEIESGYRDEDGKFLV